MLKIKTIRMRVLNVVESVAFSKNLQISRRGKWCFECTHVRGLRAGDHEGIRTPDLWIRSPTR